MIQPAFKPLTKQQPLADWAKPMLETELWPSLKKQVHAPNATPQIAVEDWDELFCAVQTRLRTSITALDLIDGKTSATVLECVEALYQLHSALTRERQQRHLPQ